MSHPGFHNQSGFILITVIVMNDVINYVKDVTKSCIKVALYLHCNVLLEEEKCTCWMWLNSAVITSTGNYV